MNLWNLADRALWAGRVSLEAARLRLHGFGRASAGLMGRPEARLATLDGPTLDCDLKALTGTARLPWSTCLTRSGALARHLRRRGIPAVLRIGVGLPEAGFAAHAWVEIEGQSINEPPAAHAGFQAIGTP